MEKPMQYNSTRDNAVQVTAAQAIVRGLSEEGGLFVPQSLPQLSGEDIAALAALPYAQRAERILSLFLGDFTPEEVADCAARAYTAERFRSEAIAPLHELREGVHILELWHGPTCAFKDMALQILPHLMRVSAGKTADGKEIVILGATSGDTGKAALEGFRDAPHTRILVFYPEQGVSPMQKLQMITQEGANVAVCAIRGNFDDAQSGVKRIFTDPAVARKLETQGMMFSSANSINLGRLAPQVAYYFKSYMDLVRRGEIAMGEEVNFVVPTGNFGDILAGDFARRMGLPVAKLICASNANNVLTAFIRTGLYDRRRAFHKTASPSMDILVSSNLERYLYLESGRDAALVARLMRELTEKGAYTAPEGVRKALSERFWAGCADDTDTFRTIARVWHELGYLLDTHTAVAWSVYERFRQQDDNGKKTVVLATASPYKFAASVLTALGKAPAPGFAALDELNALTGVPVPKNLAAIRDLPVLHTDAVEKRDMLSYVKEAIR